MPRAFSHEQYGTHGSIGNRKGQSVGVADVCTIGSPEQARTSRRNSLPRDEATRIPGAGRFNTLLVKLYFDFWWGPVRSPTFQARIFTGPFLFGYSVCTLDISVSFSIK